MKINKLSMNLQRSEKQKQNKITEYRRKEITKNRGQLIEKQQEG